MLNPDLPDIAVEGDLGIDVFRRVDEPMKGRAHYSCLCTVRTDADGTRRVDSYSRHAARNPAQMLDAAASLDADAALQSGFALARRSDWPRAGAQPSPLRLFQYLDFFRAWQVADMTIAGFEASRAASPQATPDLAETASVLRLLTDLNLIRRGVPLAVQLLPHLQAQARIRARSAPPGGAAVGEDADRYDNTGYGLRLIADLLVRDGDHTRALAAIEASLRCGDNRFRRRRAIAAAHAAGDHDRARHHLAAFARQWELPGDLARLQARLDEGAPQQHATD